MITVRIRGTVHGESVGEHGRPTGTVIAIKITPSARARCLARNDREYRREYTNVPCPFTVALATFRLLAAS